MEVTRERAPSSSICRRHRPSCGWLAGAVSLMAFGKSTFRCSVACTRNAQISTSPPQSQVVLQELCISIPWGCSKLRGSPFRSQQMLRCAQRCLVPCSMPSAPECTRLDMQSSCRLMQHERMYRAPHNDLSQQGFWHRGLACLRLLASQAGCSRSLSHACASQGCARRLFEAHHH